MPREITGQLYKIRCYSGVIRYVECTTINDLYRYIAEKTVEGYAITSVNLMCDDGSTPKIRLFSDKDFKRILSQYRNFSYAKRRLIESLYNIEEYNNVPNYARVHFRDSSGEFTQLGPCDDTREGFVTIEGEVQNIDEWLERGL